MILEVLLTVAVVICILGLGIFLVLNGNRVKENKVKTPTEDEEGTTILSEEIIEFQPKQYVANIRFVNGDSCTLTKINDDPTATKEDILDLFDRIMLKDDTINRIVNTKQVLYMDIKGSDHGSPIKFRVTKKQDNKTRYTYTSYKKVL